MKFQITSHVRQLAPSTVRYLGRKYKQYDLEFKKCLCEKIASGQGVLLEKMFSYSKEDEGGEDSHDEIDDFLKVSLEA